MDQGDPNKTAIGLGISRAEPDGRDGETSVVDSVGESADDRLDGVAEKLQEAARKIVGSKLIDEWRQELQEVRLSRRWRNQHTEIYSMGLVLATLTEARSAMLGVGINPALWDTISIEETERLLKYGIKNFEDGLWVIEVDGRICGGLLIRGTYAAKTRELLRDLETVAQSNISG